MRTLVLWCPDWPVVAAGGDAGHPADASMAVFSANRVVASNASARANGVLRGMRRRQAQSRCPELVVLPADTGRDARLFEPVAAAVEDLAPGIEVIRPGVLAVPAQGPARYFGGEQRAAERMVDHVAARAAAEAQIGIADGLFAATLAARRGRVVPSGRSAGFLFPLDITELRYSGGVPDAGRAELVSLLGRLGLHTMGAFAEIPERSVASRFGADAVLAHRQARGLAAQPLARRNPHPDLAVSETFDPPLDRVDVAAFAARSAAERLHETLAARAMACSRLGIHARTENGEEHYRAWQCAEPLCAEPLAASSGASGIADRVRWQLQGWLTGGAEHPSAGLVELRLEPEETISGTALQSGLWRGAEHAEDERAGRALARVQALLGPEHVCTAVLRGGRGPAEQVRRVPWGDKPPDRSTDEQPWPGSLPEPAPAAVFAEPKPTAVRDENGSEVAVTGRGLLTAVPAEVTTAGAAPATVLGWAGPWPVDERWWGPTGGRRLARLQVLLSEPGSDGNSALLLARRNERWFVEGRYD